MTEFYDRMAATARTLLTRYGGAMTLQRISTTFDPIEGEGSRSIQDLPVRGLFQDIDTRLFPGALIQKGDRQVVIDATQEPKMKDALLVNGMPWSIVNIRSVNPAGTPLVHFLHVRR